MGVVYKLKDEVVQFILKQKKDVPSLSCRKLADIVNEKFNTKVSKSSVNTILKNANLSDQVGRKPKKGEQAKKFMIPEDKKKIIQEDLNNAGLKEAAKEEKPLEKQPAKESPQEPPKKIEAPTRKVDVPTGQILDGCGLIFLKAAQWEMEDGNSVTKLLSKYADDDPTELSYHQLDACMMLTKVGYRWGEDLSAFSNQAIWKMCGVTKPDRGPNLNLWQERFQSAKEFVIEYQCVLQQLMVDVVGLRIQLADENQIFIDSEIASLYPDVLSGRFASSLNKALHMLSYFIISNNEAIVLWLPDGLGLLSAPCTNLVGSLSGNSQKQIANISVMDQSNQEVAGFTSAPKMERNFILCLSASHEDFQRLTQSTKWVEKDSFYHQKSNRTYYYSKTQTALLKDNIGDIKEHDVVTIWGQEDKEAKTVLITNLIGLSTEDIVEKFLDRWPLAESPQEETGQESTEKNVEFDELNTLEDILNDYVEKATQYFQKHFLPNESVSESTSELLRELFSLPGTLREGEGSLEVWLKFPAGDQKQSQMVSFINYINNRYIVDPSGRRIFINILN